MKENRLNKHGSRQLRLPVPKLLVFYNGTTVKPEETVLELRDSFAEGSDPDIDVKVRMLNVNYGGNEGLLRECRPLNEYSWLVEEIRKNQTKGGIENAVDAAISSMPKGFEIKPYLEAHRAEVRGMLLTEYDEAEAMELFREDGRAEGREEGRAEERHEMILSMFEAGADRSLIQKVGGLTDEEFEAYREDFEQSIR